jgi:hypothetical protein
MMTVMDNIILDLYRERWSGNLADGSIQEMRNQLHKTLTDQCNGYWSGHTAYHIARDGGFLIDAKHENKKPKKLTSFGKAFMESMK